MAVTINGASPTTAQQREFAAAMGLPVLLQTVTVGTAQQDIDFTSLDLDADVTYRIELVLCPNAAESQTTRMFFNADTTVANYTWVQVQGNAGVVNGTASADAAIAFVAAPNSVNNTCVVSIVVGKIAGKRPASVSNCTAVSVDVLLIQNIAHRWSGTANVTSIKLRHSTLFGVGTVAKIYKV